MLESQKKSSLLLLKFLRYLNKHIDSGYTRNTFTYFFEKIKKNFYTYRTDKVDASYEQQMIFSAIETYPSYIKKIKIFRIYIELVEMSQNRPLLCKTSLEYFLHQNFLLIIRKKFNRLRKLLLYLESRFSVRKFIVDSKGKGKEICNKKTVFKNFNRKYKLLKRNTNIFLNYHLKLMKFASTLDGESETVIDQHTLNYISIFYEKLYRIFNVVDKCFTDDLDMSVSKLQYFKEEIKNHIKLKKK